MSKDKFVIIPCSGIGKAVGTVTREATYEIVDNLRKDKAMTSCLALLTMGDEKAKKLVQNHRCIAIDGCPSQCSKKNILTSGGKIIADFITTEILRENRGLKPQGIISLNKDGHKLVDSVVEKVLRIIDTTEETSGADHND